MTLELSKSEIDLLLFAIEKEAEYTHQNDLPRAEFSSLEAQASALCELGDKIKLQMLDSNIGIYNLIDTDVEMFDKPVNMMNRRERRAHKKKRKKD